MEKPRLNPDNYPQEEEDLFHLIGVDRGRSIGVPREGGWEDDILNITFRHIEMAMIDALKRHGKPTDDPVRGSTTLTEECGEVAECALDATRPGGVTIEEELLALSKMYVELAQAAGYSFLLMISMSYKIGEVKQRWQTAKTMAEEAARESQSSSFKEDSGEAKPKV